MKYIIGLGNPGTEYALTRHNVGWLALDRFVATNRLGNFDTSNSAVVLKTAIGGQPILIVKPLTYMNRSGEIYSLLENLGEAADIPVIHDDIDLKFGQIRVRAEGSSAGHKGVQSLIDRLGQQFWRLRIGIGPNGQVATADFVLQNFSPNEQDRLVAIFTKTNQLITDFANAKLTAASYQIDL